MDATAFDIHKRARNQHIRKLRRRGLTFAAIGSMYGISRARVEQIVHRERFNARRRVWRHLSSARQPHQGRYRERDGNRPDQPEEVTRSHR